MTLDAIEKLLSEITPGGWRVEKIAGSSKLYRLTPKNLLGKDGAPTAMEVRSFIEHDVEFIAAAPDLVRKLLAVVKAVKGFKVVETANELGPNDNPYWVLTCKSYEPFLKALSELEK